MRIRGCSEVLLKTLVYCSTVCLGIAIKNITIGYLTVDKTPKELDLDKQGRKISGAITIAIEKINSDPTLLPEHRLVLMWGDTQADTFIGTRLLTEHWKSGAVVFFGFEDSCSVEAKVAAAWNLPLFSYKCADSEVSNKKDFPTFVRTFPPVAQVSRSVISLLLEYNWHKFSLVVGSKHGSQVIARNLTELAEHYNLTVNSREDFKEPHIPLTTGNPFPGIVERTFVDTRVYVLLGSLNAMVDLMSNMQDRGLLDTGEYIVIYVDLATFSPNDPTNSLKYFHRTADHPASTTNSVAARSLLVITGSPADSEDYDHFKTKVSHYTDMEPFCFPNPFKQLREVTVYAAYLYDSVMLYAEALHEILAEGNNITNGSAIVDKVRGKTYQGIQGFTSRIDMNGDGEGNYTVLARIPHEVHYDANHTAKYTMQPVGHFQMHSLTPDLPAFRMFDRKKIYWVAGDPPIDEPDCGYRGQRCIPPKTYTLEIALGVVGGITLIAIIVGIVMYRNRRYEQEIAGLLWRISRDELKTADPKTGQDRRASFGSKLTLSQLSVDSRMSFTQVYVRTGTYKGQIVALKVYEKKYLNISRKMQKEMKIMRDLRHNNINAFNGACIDPPSFIIVTEYCPKGSLLDVLENEDMKLDNMFAASLVKDIIQGMIFLHDSELGYHGNLKSSNCVITSRWALQITDFGLLDLRAGTYNVEDEHAFFRNLFWKAPELLKVSGNKGSQKGDVYSFAIILHEIFGRAGPFGFCNMTPRDIIGQVKACSNPPFRPDIKQLTCDKYVVECMQCCWNEDPEQRLDFRAIWKCLHPLRQGMKRNIFDNMMAMMERYQKNLEDIVEERTTQLIEEKKKTEALLLRMLPKCVADQLKRGEAVIPEAYTSVTIFFSDIVGFTKLSAESTPMQVVDMLNDLYTIFDSIIRNYEVYKIETIGDAYMVVSGLPTRNGDSHAGEIASMSLHLLREIKLFKIRHRPNQGMQLRIGMHSGPCVAGVVGLTMPRYTLFGDTVNTASRMETTGEPMKIHCSAESKEILDKLQGYKMEPRGNIPMKGKGEKFTYWLVGEDENVRKIRMKNSVKKLCTGIPCTPSTAVRCFSCRKKHLKGKGGSVDASPSNNRADTDSVESKQPENDILTIIRHADVKSPRDGSPKHFFTAQMRSESPVAHPTVHGFNSVQFKESLSANGDLPSNNPIAHRTSSGPNVNNSLIQMFGTNEPNNRFNETDALLVRRYSFGTKLKSKPSPLVLPQNQQFKPISRQDNVDIDEDGIRYSVV